MLDDPFLEELGEAFAEAFELGGIRRLEVGKDFRREARDFVKTNGNILRHSVADAQAVIAHEPHHITGEGFIHGLPVPAKEDACGAASGGLPVFAESADPKGIAFRPGETMRPSPAGSLPSSGC